MSTSYFTIVDPPIINSTPDEELLDDNIVIFPNPSKEILEVKCKTGLMNYIGIFNLNGQVQFEKMLLNSKYYSISILNYVKSVYYLKIQVDNKFYYKGFIKN